ncbi:hypothetical protein GCM10022394_09670 [Zobellella aerophila]|uniref:PE family protein n=1 Tax=Zobellella aerophila TaxID=870480 RepID=A0ABP6VF57_9GAMM
MAGASGIVTGETGSPGIISGGLAGGGTSTVGGGGGGAGVTGVTGVTGAGCRE